MNTDTNYESEFLPVQHPFTDDFIFMNVMRHPKICRGILELILPNEKFGAIRIRKSENPFVDNSEINEDADGNKVENGPNVDASEQTDTFENLNTETQKTLKLAKDAHGVRFDAFAEADRFWAEIEMQTGSILFLGKRSRYYQANMDLDFLEQGQPYDKLKPSYVIFICTFDYFKKDEPVYFFRSWDVENGLPLDDFSYKIVLNTACSPAKVPEKLKAFYAYINDPKKSQASELTRMIDERVRKFNSGEWRRKYMTFEQILSERERKSFAQGHAEGLTEGAAKKQREIAKSLKDLGVGTTEIIKATGLSPEELDSL